MNISLQNKTIQNNTNEISLIVNPEIVAPSIKLNSKILLDTPENKSKISFLCRSLRSFKNLQLLFRASEHQFRSEEFHRCCDGVPRTLTLIRTEFNRIFGAYTECKWSSSNAFVCDPAESSFLLQLD